MRRFAVLLLVPLALSSCGGGPKGGIAAVQHSRSTLQWAMVGTADVPTLDPALASDPASISVCSLIYGGLVGFDSHLAVVPSAAQSWVISRNGLVYTFHLRPDLRFADGRAVVAQDVVNSLVRALGPTAASGVAPLYLNLIARNSSGAPAVSALGRTIVRIVLVRPAAHFLSELAFPAAYVPEPGLPQLGPSWTDHAAGFGPYEVSSWQHGASLVLARNRYFWQGAAKFKRIVIHFEAEKQATGAYSSGKIDLISGFEAGQPPAENLPGSERVPALALDYLAFNTTRPALRHLNVRRAFLAATKRVMTAGLLDHSAFEASGLLPPALGVISTAWHPRVKPSVYLARAGYPAGKHFPDVTLITPRDPRILGVARSLVNAYASKLNVAVTLRALDPSTYNSFLSSGQFDLALVRWGADYPDPQDFLGTQLGASNDNITGWTSKRFDQLVALADAYNPADIRRLQLFRQAAAIAARKIPLLPLEVPAQTAFVRPDLLGVAITPLGTTNLNPRRAQLKP